MHSFVLGFEIVVIEGKRNGIYTQAVYTDMNGLLRILGKSVHARYIWHTKITRVTYTNVTSPHLHLQKNPKAQSHHSSNVVVFPLCY